MQLENFVVEVSPVILYRYSTGILLGAQVLSSFTIYKIN
jgi:hypothetical protein